jgi:GGDEF domain-containing protein
MSIHRGSGRNDALSAVSPLWRYRWLRVLLVAAPGITAAVGVLTAMEANLGFVVALNLAAGVIVSSLLFVAVSIVARRVTDERLELTRATEQEIWRARATRFSIRDDNSGLYADWYFRLRLQEEVERAKRYGVRFALMIVKPIGLHTDTELLSPGSWFAEHLQRHLRRSDLPALLQDGSLGIIMPNTGHRAAATVQQRIAGELAKVEPHSGVACYPDDANTIALLLEVATKRCQEAPPGGRNGASAEEKPAAPKRRRKRAAVAATAAAPSGPLAPPSP